MQRDLAQELESVIVQIGGLELIITAKRVGTQESSGNEASSSTAAAAAGVSSSASAVEAASDFSDPFSITRALKDEVIAAETPAALSGISLPFLTYLECRLKDCFADGVITCQQKPEWQGPFELGAWLSGD